MSCRTSRSRWPDAGRPDGAQVAGGVNFKFNGLPAEEFPSLAEHRLRAVVVTVKGDDLHGLIHHTSFAVSTEESRPILNGVLWELRDGEMKMVATNGHRLAQDGEFPSTSSGNHFGRFHRAAEPRCTHVQRLFKGADTSYQVARDSGNHLGFQRGFDGGLLAGSSRDTYPNYDQVIPRDNDKEATVAKKALGIGREVGWRSWLRTRRTASGMKFESGHRPPECAHPRLG